MKNTLAIFEDFKIRRVWNEKQEKWYFSVIDIISVLTQQADFKKAHYRSLCNNHVWLQCSHQSERCQPVQQIVLRTIRWIWIGFSSETDEKKLLFHGFVVTPQKFSCQ